MKKIKYFLLMAFSVLLLSACTMKYETDVNIKADGSMEFAIITGYDKEFITALMSAGDSFGSEDATEPKEETGDVPTEPTDEEIAEYFYSSFSSEEDDTKKAEDLGFKVEKYHEGDFYGYRFVGDITHIDTVSGEEEVKFDISKIVDENNTTKIQDQKMFRKQGNVYYATFVFDPTKQNLDSSEITGESGADAETQAQIEQYMQSLGMEYKFVVTLPNEANDNNATTVSEDKKTLTWDLGTSQTTNINFTFQIGASSKPVVTPGSEGPNIQLVIGIAGGAILLVLIIFVITSKNKKKKAIREEAASTGVENAAVAQPEEPKVEETVSIETSTETPSITPEPVAPAPSEGLMVEPSLQTTEIVTPEPVSTVETPKVEGPASIEPVETVNIEPVSTPEVEMPATEPVMPTSPSEPVASMVAPSEEVIPQSNIDTNNNI